MNSNSNNNDNAILSRCAERATEAIRSGRRPYLSRSQKHAGTRPTSFMTSSPIPSPSLLLSLSPSLSLSLSLPLSRRGHWIQMRCGAASPSFSLHFSPHPTL